jgi:hypothetical protein
LQGTIESVGLQAYRSTSLRRLPATIGYDFGRPDDAMVVLVVVRAFCVSCRLREIRYVFAHTHVIGEEDYERLETEIYVIR